MKPKVNKVQKTKTGNSSKVQKNKKSALTVKEENKNPQNLREKKQLMKKIVQQPQEVVVPVKTAKNVASGKQEKANINQNSPESSKKKSNTNGGVMPVGEVKKDHVAPVGKTKKYAVVPVNKIEKGIVPAKANQSTKPYKVGQKKQKAVNGVPLGPKTKHQTKRDNKLMFQKNERVKKNIGSTIVKPEKKVKPKQPTVKYEPLPFDEEKFNEIVTVENVKKVSAALKEMVQKEVATKKTPIFSDFKYILNVASFKMPDCPKHMVKLRVKHSLVDKNDDVVLIVPDLYRGSSVDYEPTKQYYEDILRKAGVEGLTVMPFNQLRKEYNTFEAVRKFSNTYDYFLCDGRVVGHAQGVCGRGFQNTRTILHSVRLDANNIKREIENSLNRTGFRQLLKGNQTSIPVGTHKHTTQQLAENIVCVVEQLKTLFPGGVENIRNMYLKIAVTGTSALPIYISMAQPPEKTPYIVGPREQRMLKMRKDANDVLSKFALTKDASLVKLNKTQIERKRKLQDTHKVLKAEAEAAKAMNDASEEAKPAKKARKEDESSKKAIKDVKPIQEKSGDDDEDGEDEVVLEDDDNEDDAEGGEDDDYDDDDDEEDEEDSEA